LPIFVIVGFLDEYHSEWMLIKGVQNGRRNYLEVEANGRRERERKVEGGKYDLSTSFAHMKIK
jgi:hypothetical protein